MMKLKKKKTKKRNVKKNLESTRTHSTNPPPAI